MKTVTRKFIRLSVVIMSVITLIFAVMLTANAQQTVVDSGKAGTLDWTLYSDGQLKIEGQGEIPDYEECDLKELEEINEVPSGYAPWMKHYKLIKDVVIEDGVTRIGTASFMNCCFLKDITLPDSLKEIGYCAFMYCLTLEDVDLNKVEAVEPYAFAYCVSLVNVDFGMMKEIGEASFAYCISLQQANLPEGLTCVPDNAFVECMQLRSVTIPSTVTELGQYAFGYYAPLDKVVNNSPYVAFFSTSGQNGFKDKISAEHYLFTFSESQKLSILYEYGVNNFDELFATEEDMIDYIRVKFNDKFSLSMEFEEFYNYIGEIENNMLGGISSYTKIYCPEESAEHSFCKENGVKHYINADTEEHFCFDTEGTDENISWTLDKEAKTLTLSGSGEMKDYDIYDNNPAPWNALRNYIDKIVFSDECNITRIGEYAFSGMPVRSVILPSTVTSIGEYAFSESMVESIVIPSSVEVLGRRAFSYCSNLSVVTFEENSAVTEIGESVFASSSLKQIEIPKSVTDVSSNAFRYCYSLEKITVEEGNTSFVSQDGILYNSDKTGIIICPNGIKGEIVIPASIASLSSSAFCDCLNLTKVSFEEGSAITSIPQEAFYDCYSLKTVVIPDSVTDIGYSAFNSCKALENVVFGEGSALTSVGSYAFSSCTSLKNIELPSSFSSLSSDSFLYCSALEEISFGEGNLYYSFENGMVFNADKTKIIFCLPSKTGKVTIPSTVTSIGDSAFSSCTKITEVAFDEGISLSEIPSNAFYQSNIKKITVPASVTRICYNAFYYCRELEEVIFEDNSSLARIESSAFYGCKSLKKIIIPASCSYIGSRAFRYCDAMESITILNKDCSIDNSYYYDSVIPSHIKIIGYSGSTAEDYAVENGNAFEDVDGKTLDSITVETMPHKTVYKQGFPFVRNGLTISLNYSDGTSVIKSSGFNVSGFDSSNPGKCTVYVSYGGVTGSFEVDIVEYADPVLKINEPSTVYVGQNETIKFKYIPKVSGVYKFTAQKELENTNLYVYLRNSDGGYISSMSVWDESEYFSNELTGGETYIFETYFGPSDSAADVTLTVEPIEVYCSHNNTEDFPEVPAGCTNTGFTAGTFCYDCETWSQGHEFIDITHTNADDDIYCDKCGRDYRKVVKTGACGDEATFVYYDNGDLEISGKGKIYDYFFDDKGYYISSMRNLIIGEGITSIGRDAFANKYIVKIYLPSTLEVIEEDAFFGYCMYDDFERGEYFNTYVDDISTWFNIDFENSSSNPVSNYGCLYADGEKVTEVVVPMTVTEIKDNAFNNYQPLEKITFSSNLISIGANAFDNCDSLTEIVLPDSLEEIGSYAFNSCSSLKKLVFGGSPTSIGENAFSYCSGVDYLEAPASLKIENNAMQYVSEVDELVITKGSKTPADFTRSTYSQTPWYYSRESVKKVTFEEGTERIGNYALYDMTNVVEVVFPVSLKEIGEFALSYTALSYLDLPENLEEIGANAFSSCGSLVWVVVNKNIKTIGDSAFASDFNIKGAAYRGSESDWSAVSVGSGNSYLTDKLNSYNYNGETGEVVYSGTVGSIGEWKLLFPGKLVITGTGDMPDYSSSSSMPWYNYSTAIFSVEIGEGIARLGNNSFYNFDYIKSVKLPESLVSIGNYAFYDCYALKIINLPDSVTSIGYNAFKSCRKIKTANLPEALVSLGDSAFNSCSSLEEVYIGKNIEAISTDAFYCCKALKAFEVSEENTNFTACDGILYSKDKTVLIDYPSAKEDKSFTVPESITEIKEYAFDNTKNLESVSVPDNVTLLPQYSFYNCSSLKEATVPVSACKNRYTFSSTDLNKLIFTKGTDGIMADFSSEDYTPWSSSKYSLETVVFEDGVAHVGSYAFYRFGKLKNVAFADSITSIGNNAFEDCYYLEDFVLPSELTSIGNSAFMYCGNLRNITIPSKVSSIGVNAFNGCNGLTLTVDENNPYLTIDDGVIYSKDKTHLISYPVNKSAASFTVPSTVTHIDINAFYNADNLQTVVLSENLQEIGEGAFKDCDYLKEAIIPDTVKVIGNEAFRSCDRLTEVGSSEALEEIGEYAFYECAKLTGMPSSDVLSSIGSYAFYSCLALEEVSLPESLTEINKYAFYNCSAVTELVIPEAVTTIDYHAFNGCSNIQTLTMPASAYVNGSAFTGVTSIKNITLTKGTGVMSNYSYRDYYNAPWYISRNSLESLVISEGITNIGAYAFADNTFNTITLPESLVIIGDNAFLNCTSFDDVVIPEGVTTIGAAAFSYCAFENIVLPEGLESLGNSAFYGCASLKEAVIPKKITAIGTYLFYGCSSLEKVTMSDDVTDIGKYAFYNCTSLKEVGLSDSLISIGTYAFNGCTALGEIIIPEGVTTVSEHAFSGCSAIEKVIIPDTVTSLGDYAFEGCSSLEYLKIPVSLPVARYYKKNIYVFDSSVVLKEITFTPGTGAGANYGSLYSYTPWYNSADTLEKITFEEGITSIGTYMFRGFKNSSVITLPSTLKAIGNYAFYESGLAEINLNEGLETIGTYAFNSSSALKSITVPGSVKIINDYAFAYCSALEDVVISEGVEAFNQYAFRNCTALEELNLPSSLKTVNNYILYSSGVRKVNISDSVTTISTNAFNSAKALLEINVDENNSNYSSVDGVLLNGDGTSIVKYPEGRTDESYTLPLTVKTVPSNVFYNVAALNEIILPENVEKIDSYGFNYVNTNAVVKIYNKNCNIYNSSYTVKCSIAGHTSSTAKTYATSKGRTFISICDEFDSETKYEGECGSDIIKTTYCTVCNGVLAQETTNEFINHTASDWIVDKEATCTADGKRHKECTNCFKVLEEEILTRLGHDEPEKWTVEKVADCENGGRKYKSCKRCHILLDEELSSATGHSYESTYYPPESDSEGYTEYICASCGDTYTVLDPAAALEGFGAFGAVHQNEITWMKAVEASVTGYEIFRKTADGEYILAATVSSRDTLSWIDKNVTVGQEYTYKMYAVKGTVKGMFTEEKTAIPQADTILPEILKLEPSVNGASYGGNIPLKIEAKDNMAVSYIEVYTSVDGGVSWNFAYKENTNILKGELDISVFDDGELWIKAYAYDTSGNRSESSVVRKYKVDNTPPSKVTGIAIGDCSNKSVFLKWNDVSDEDRKGFCVQIDDGKGFKTYRECVQTVGTVVTGLKPSAEYKFRVAAVDMCGNIGEYSKTVTVTTEADTSAPVITALSPDSRSFNGSIPFTVSAKDEFGIAKIVIQSSPDKKIWTDCAEKVFASETVKETFNIATDSYSEGVIALRAVATDIYGNTVKENIPYIEYNIDRTAPGCVKDIAATGCDGYIAVTWNAFDSKDDERYTVYRSDREDGDYSIVSGEVKTLGYNDVYTEKDKTYYYKVKITDSAGNTGEFSDIVSARTGEDTKAPDLKIFPSDDSYIGPKSKTVTVNAADNGVIDSVIVEYKKAQSWSWTVLKNVTDINTPATSIKVDLPVSTFADSDVIQLRARVLDAAGHYSDYVQVKYTVDKTPVVINNPMFSVDERGVLSVSWQDGGETDVQGFIINALKDDKAIYLGAVGKNASGSYSFSHNISEYETADYTFAVESHDGAGNIATAVSDVISFDRDAVIHVPVAKIVAVTQMEEKVSEYFDALSSYDRDGEIVSYEWDFGDGTTSTKARPSKSYAAEGIYTVTLTVTDNEGLQSVAVRNVVVHKRLQFGEISVKVIDVKGEPITGASVKVDGEDAMHLYTDEFGVARFRVPVGNHFVSGYLNGEYLPEIKNTVVYTEQTSYVTLVLEAGAPVAGKFTVERLELEEIKELIEKGFDPDALENNQVFESTVTLSKEKPSDPDLKVNIIYNEKNEVIDWNYKEEQKEEDEDEDDTTEGSGKDYDFNIGGNRYIPHRVDVWKDKQGHTYISTLSLSAETKFLKELFKVKLEVFCQVGEEFKLVDNKVSLVVPEGLSIVSGIEGYAGGAEVKLSDLLGGGNNSTSCTWIISGDSEGEYDLKADYIGTLYSVEHSKAFETVTAQFITDEPIKVHGISTVKTVYNVAESFHNGRYYFNLGIQNVGDLEVYYPDVNFSNNTIKVFEEKYEESSRGEQFDPEKISVVQSGSMYMIDSDGAVTEIEEFPETLKPGQAVFKKYIATGFRYYVDTDIFDKAVINDYGTNKNLNIEVNFYSPRDEIFKHYRTVATLESTVHSNTFGSAVRYDIGESTQFNLRVGWDNDFFEKYENLTACKWSNSDTSVANVGAGGSVYFKKYGYTDVSATLPEGLETAPFRFYVGNYTLEEYEEMLDFENSWLLLKVKNPKTMAFIKNFSTTTSKGTLDWGSAETYCSFNLPEIMGSKIHIKADGFRDYIIPSEVVSSFRYDERQLGHNGYIVEKNVTLAVDHKDGKGYISSVYAKGAERDGGSYIDILSEKISFLEDTDIKVIVSAVGAEGGTYVISQGGDIKLESTSGVFVDSFDKFDTEKKTVVYVKSSSGALLAEPVQINLDKEKLNQTAEDLINKTSFSFGKDFKFNVPKDIPIIGEASISIPAFNSPISVDVTNTSIKVSIGVPIMDGKSEWEYYKKSVKSAAEAIPKAKNKVKAFDTWGKEVTDRFGESGTGWSSLGGAVKFDAQFIGYMEFGVINGQLIIKDACYVSAEVSFSLSYTAQGAVLFVPGYASVSAGVTVAVSGKLSRVVPDDDIPLQWELALEVSPKLGAEAGVGFKGVASLGLGGDVTLGMKIEFLQKHLYGDISGNVCLTSELLIWDKKDMLLEGTKVFMDDYYGQQSKKLMKSFTYEMETKERLAAAAEEEPSLISRDYAENTSEWLGNKSKKLRKGEGASGVEFKALQTGVYDKTSASVVPFGEDKLLMTYIEDDPSRDDYNRFRLVYSVFDGVTWSQPKAVYDNGTLDMSPSLASDGENVYVAWIKADRAFTEEDGDDLQSTVKLMDVYTARYNPETDSFEDITNASDNDEYIASCSIAAEDGKYALYYTGISDSTRYSVKRFDGKSTQIIAEDLTSVMNLAAAGINEVTYCSDSDGILSTTGDINAYTWKNGVITAFAKEEATADSAYSQISYGTIKGEKTLFVSNGNTVYYYRNGELESATPDGSIGEFIAGDDCIFYTQNSENGSELYIMKYQKGEWKKPVQLSDMDELISNVSITSLDGNIYGICNIGRTEYDEAYQTYSVNSTDIGAFTVSDFTDLSVELFTPDENQISSLMKTKLRVSVENKGSSTPEEVTFTVTDSKGTESQQTVTLSAEPGEKEVVELDYTVPENYADTTVTVYCNAGYDRNEDDNTSSVTYGYTDIALKESSVVFENGEYYISLNAYNMSEVAAEDVVLNIRMNDEKINPFYEHKIGILEKGKYITVNFTLPEDSVEFNGEDYAKLYCSLISSGKTEAAGDDNICVILEKEQTVICDHSEVYVTPAVDATCTEGGSTEGKVCLLCAEVLVAVEDVPSEGHSCVAVKTVNPTCTGEGYTVYGCQKCDYSYNDDFVGVIPHKEVIDEAVESSCTSTGLTEGSHCEYCGKVFVSQQITSLKDHIPETVKGTPSTCKVRGKTDGKICAVCGYEIEEQRELPLVSHSFTKYVSNKNATCKADGTKTARCDYGCGKSNTVTEYGTIKDHISDSGYIKIAPTYKTEGLKVFRCVSCKKDLNSKSVDMLTLGKVNGVKISKSSSTSLTVSWNKTAGAERYCVYYAVGTGKWISRTVTGTSLTVSGLPSATVYNIRVAASAGENTGEESDILTTATKPGKVSLRSAKSSKKKTASLKWKKVSRASGYQIKYSTSKKFSKKTTKTVYVRSQKKYKAALKKLKRSKKYYVKVRAYKTAGGQKIYGSYSRVKSVRIK